jgi:hypothetical protein
MFSFIEVVSESVAGWENNFHFAGTYFCLTNNNVIREHVNASIQNNFESGQGLLIQKK